ncbi:hypothetical protein L9F63_022444, partial [Diploptera punctata]
VKKIFRKENSTESKAFIEEEEKDDDSTGGGKKTVVHKKAVVHLFVTIVRQALTRLFFLNKISYRMKIVQILFKKKKKKKIGIRIYKSEEHLGSPVPLSLEWETNFNGLPIAYLCINISFLFNATCLSFDIS